ncbi:MAG: UPF0323 family lipoprotein [Campylobacterota bacterium]|nr:UPF0323 family lipoprotein [Campylobacterota bacterium]
MKNKKYFLKKISNYAVVGGLGASLALGLTGCEQKPTGGEMSEAAQKQGAFVIVEKDPTGAHKIVDEFPSTTTTIVLREDGKERILSKAEVDALVAAEAKKIDEGTSNLTNSNSMGGMSLGETLLASAAGAIIGSYIGSKLFNNQNYQNQRKASYKSPSTYSKSVNSFNKAKSSTSKTASSSKKSGFFGSSKTSTSRSSFGG